MSYEPTEWKAGDTVTSAKLNKIEQGIASSGGTSTTLMVEMVKTQDEWSYESVMDAADIGTAFISGKTVIIHFPPWDDNCPDAYAQLAYYAPASSNPNSDYTKPCFVFSRDIIGYDSMYEILRSFAQPTVKNGKLQVSLQD